MERCFFKHLESGNYQVDLYVEGTKIASGAFSVY